MVVAPRSARPVRLPDYHAEVDAAVARMTMSLSATSDLSTAVDVLDHALRGPVALAVVDGLPYGRAQLLASARRELERPEPGSASNATTQTGLVRILLLHQIDVLWWSQLTPYADQAAIEGASELLSLPALEQAGELRFRFAAQPSGWWGRGRDYLLRRFARRRRPNVSGMKFLVARGEMVAVLNEIADTFAASAPQGTPSLWVNSTVRSVEHQVHLGTLGYSALLPSSHCMGYGVDVELSWFELFGAAEVLRSILLGYRDRDVLNVIDEGQAWHLCLSPHHVREYARPSPFGRGDV